MKIALIMVNRKLLRKTGMISYSHEHYQNNENA